MKLFFCLVPTGYCLWRGETLAVDDVVVKKSIAVGSPEWLQTASDNDIRKWIGGHKNFREVLLHELDDTIRGKLEAAWIRHQNRKKRTDWIMPGAPDESEHELRIGKWVMPDLPGYPMDECWSRPYLIGDSPTKAMVEACGYLKAHLEIMLKDDRYGFDKFENKFQSYTLIIFLVSKLKIHI